MAENLQKYIASSGICSRRRAETLIRKGRVRINRNVAAVTDRVETGDVVTVDGKAIELIQNNIYYMINKPVGYVSTNARFKGEKNVYSLVKIKERLFTIGRLDKNSSGLMVLTNDGDLTEKLTHPRYEHEKEYLVRTKQDITKDHIEKLKKGVDIGDGDGIVKAKKITQSDDREIHIVLTQGKKRQIRRMCSAIKLDVDTLQRVRIGKLELGRLPVGQSRELTKKELKLLKKS